jgi:hypothetical protein
MQRSLFQYQRERAARKRASEDHQSFDFDQGFMLAVNRMEVRRLVVAKEHPDDDSEKPAHLRDGFVSSAALSVYG